VAAEADLRRNVFVIGLDEFNHGELKSLKNADSYEFHQLLSFDDVKGEARDYPVKEALSKAQWSGTPGSGALFAVN
jgi:hypothetical protein